MTFACSTLHTTDVNPTYIYIVGKPDPKSEATHIIRALGHKVGVLLDRRLSLKNAEEYDRVEIIDYDNIEQELSRLAALNLEIRGLICTYENYVVSKAKIGEFFKVPAPSILSAQLSTDKSLMRKAFLAADRTISPEYSAVDTVERAISFANRYGYPLILKPTNLVKSLLVLKCDSEQQLRDSFFFASTTVGKLYEKYHIHDRAPQLIIEEFIVGEQYSIAAFVDDEGTPHFCNGIVKLKNAQDIGVDDNYLYSRTLPTTLPDDIVRQMYSVAEKGVRALSMKSTPAHIELMSGPSGIKIIEIGARVGGYRPRMYAYSYNIDLIEQEIRLALGEKPILKSKFSTYCAVYELFPQEEGVFYNIIGDINPEKLTYYRITAEPGDRIGPAKNGFKATAIIIVTHKNKQQFDNLCHAVDTLRVKVR